MDSDNMIFVGAVVVVILIIVFAPGRRGGRKRPDANRESSGSRAEALFVSMFPELQPHFHPDHVVEFVRARQARTPPREGTTVKAPEGFAAAASAEVLFDDKAREHWKLLDAAGAVLAKFRYEDHPEGAALRVGQGKLTVNLQDKSTPKVRYWHPEREFKWTDGSWKFQTRVSESSFDSDSSSSSSSTSSSSPSTAAAATAAGAAAIVAAGGTFDGGGASAAWSGDGSRADGDSGEGATAAAY